jgi:putative MFS transporter
MSASGRPTLDDKINAAGLGWYQARLFAMLSLIVIADGMEMTVLTMLRAPAMREFGIDEYGFAVLGSVIFGGMLVGSLAGGAIADLYGRRTAMLMAGTAFCVFGVGSALAPDLYSFAFARVLTGFGVGGMVPVADSLLLEWSPTQWRSKLVMSMIGVAFAMGSILAAGSGILLYETLGGGEGSVWWRVLLLVCTVPGLTSLPWMFFALPESVHFLMCNGRHAEAVALLKDLERINGVELAANAVISEREFVPGHAEGHVLDWRAWGDMFRPGVRGSTLYLVVTFSACGFVYYGFSFIYPHTLEQLYGVAPDEAFGQLMVVSVVEVMSCIAFTLYMDLELVGRRGAMLTAWFLVCVCSILAISLKADRALFEAANLLLKGMCGAAFTVVYVYAGELIPSTVRATAISVSGCFGRLATMCAPAILTALLNDDVNLVYLCYLGVSGVALVAGMLQYRETLGQPLHITHDYPDSDKHRLASRNFSGEYGYQDSARWC